MDAMKDLEGEQVITSHKVGFRNTLEITDKGIRDRKLSIPYSLIKECNCYRNHWGVPDRCGIKYIDQSGLDRFVEFGGNAIKVYSDILQVSKQNGYEISQQRSWSIARIANQLKRLDIESEFIEPRVEHNRGDYGGGSASWQMDMGGLKLRGTNIDTVTLHESGFMFTSGGTPGGDVKVDIQYSVNYIVRIQTIPDITCFGKPLKKFLGRTVDYRWGGGVFTQKPEQGTTLGKIMMIKALGTKETREERERRWAAHFGYRKTVVFSNGQHSNVAQDNVAQSLNEDTQLRRMLVKAKAPVIEIRGNNMRIQGKKLPTMKLFQCIDRIAEHIR